MLESTFLEDWDDIGTKMAKKGHFLPKSGINSELVSIQRVKMPFRRPRDQKEWTRATAVWHTRRSAPLQLAHVLAVISERNIEKRIS